MVKTEVGEILKPKQKMTTAERNLKKLTTKLKSEEQRHQLLRDRFTRTTLKNIAGDLSDRELKLIKKLRKSTDRIITIKKQIKEQEAKIREQRNSNE